MLNSLSVCGDSFGVGVGISDDPKKIISGSFGAQVAKHYNIPLSVFARSGCCNYVIYLQVKKIIQQFKKNEINPFVLITTTHHSRFVLPITAEENYVQYDLSDVEYKLYNFFNTDEEFEDFLPFELNKEPKLVSETISNFFHFNKYKKVNLKKLFFGVGNKIDLIGNYFKQLYSDSIKHDYDMSLIVMMHLELKNCRIPHLILSPNDYLSKFIDRENFLKNDWGYYSRKYPDVYGSGHCTVQGHTELSKKIISHIDQGSYKFLKANRTKVR